MKSKANQVNCATLWNDFFEKRMEEHFENKVQTEIIDFYKENLKNRKRNAKSVRKRRKPALEEAVLSNNPGNNLPCIDEQSEEIDSKTAAPEYPSRRATSSRAAAKKAAKETSIQLNQSLHCKLRNPGTSPKSSRRNKSVLDSVQDKERTEVENELCAVEVATKKCSVILERSEELDTLAVAPIKNTNEAESFINDSDIDVFKVPPVPLKKCKVTFKLSNAASQNISTKNESNLVDPSTSQSKELEQSEALSSQNINEVSSSNDHVLNSSNKSESQSRHHLVEATSTNSSDLEGNKRPARTRTRNKKYNDEEFSFTLKKTVNASCSNIVSNSSETQGGRGKKRKSDEALNKPSKVAKTLTPAIVIDNCDESVNKDETNISSNLVSSSIDPREASGKVVTLSLRKNKSTSADQSPVQPKSVVNEAKTSKTIQLSSIEQQLSPELVDKRTHNIPSPVAKNKSPLINDKVPDSDNQLNKNKKSPVIELNSPFRKDKSHVFENQCLENVVESSESANIEILESPVKQNSPAELKQSSKNKPFPSMSPDHFYNDKCIPSFTNFNTEMTLPSTSQTVNEPEEAYHSKLPSVNENSPICETPKPEPRMTRTRTREQKNKKVNEVLTMAASSNIKMGKENKLRIPDIAAISGKKKLLTPLSSAKAANNMFSPASKSHSKYIGSASGKKPATVALSAIDKKNEILKANIEEQKRKREEKEKKILLHRQAVEKEKQERIAKAMKEKLEKEKAIAEAQRLREEQMRLKKLQTEAMIREAEERRLKEEEAKKAHHKKLEEEKRKLAEIRMKQAEEARKLQEKRLQDKAKEESIAEAAKLKKLKALQTQAKTESYQLTPAREDMPPLPPKTENDYGLDEDTDASDDDSEQPKKSLPKWAAGTARMAQTISQMKVSNAFYKHFFHLSSGWQINMSRILESSGFKNILHGRRSSAVWNTPDISKRY